MIRADESTGLGVPSSGAAVSAAPDEAEQFLVWKSQLLRKLRAADLAVKIAILLPLFMPALLFWSLFYWFGLLAEQMREGPFLYLYTAFFVFIPYYYYLRGLEKLTKRHKKKKFVEADWSKPKYRELAAALTSAGADLTTLTCRVTVEDSWNIHAYPRMREPPRPARKTMILYTIVYLMVVAFSTYLRAGWVIVVASVPGLVVGVALLIKTTVFIIREMVRPVFSLIISTRVLTYLKGEPDKFRLLIAHELSHIKHRDPLRRVVWNEREEHAGFFLFWGTVVFIIGTVVGWNTVPAWAFISCALAWFVALLPISDLVPLFQELRADLDAIKTASEREVLLQLLRDIPIESKHQRYLNRNISLRQLVSVIGDASHLMRINEQKDVMSERVAMLEAGEIELLNEGRLRLRLLTCYAAATLTLIASQIYLWQLALYMKAGG
jgi:Zn-dependent protease with chaperone function